MCDSDRYWGCAVIKVSDLWAEVKKVAAEQPDYVYPEQYCRYQNDGKPSCIVGQALYRLGMPVSVLVEIDAAHGQGGISAYGLPYERPDLFVDDSASDLFALAEAQEAQDNRLPWGEAVGGVQ